MHTPHCAPSGRALVALFGEFVVQTDPSVTRTLVAGNAFARSVLKFHAANALRVERAFVWFVTVAKMNCLRFKDTPYATLVSKNGGLYLASTGARVSFVSKPRTLDEVRDVFVCMRRCGAVAVRESGSAVERMPDDWPLNSVSLQMYVVTTCRTFARCSLDADVFVHPKDEDECAQSVFTRSINLHPFGVELLRL